MRKESRRRRIARQLGSYLSDSSLSLPAAMSPELAVPILIEAFEAEHGATFSLYFGLIANQRLFAVSIYPDRGRELPGNRVTTGILRQFIRENHNLLRDPRHCVGVWYDAASNTTFLDISVVLSDRSQAIELGEEYNQIGVFELE